MAQPPIPLADEDRAILELESETIAGHTCKVIVLAGDEAPGLDVLREAVAGRLPQAPELTRKLGMAGGSPAWVADHGFDVRDHIVAAPVSGEIDGAGLAALTAELFAQRLDRARPLWRIDFAPMAGGNTALVWRLHHALADGTTAVRLARAVLFDPEATTAEPGPRPGPAHAARDDARRRGHLAGFLRREFARSRSPSPFDAHAGARRLIDFAHAPLRQLHDAARGLADATLNDAVLAAVAGGLRRWLELHHGPLGDVRVKVPVSLHQEGEEAGNRDSFFALALPLAEPDPVARLRAIRTATAERKADHDAQEMDDLLRQLAGVSRRLERFAERFERSPRSFALNVSNVPGPRAEERILGARVALLQTLAEIGERHALRVAVISYAGLLCFGICADADALGDLDGLARGIEAEAATLVDRAADD